MIYNIIFFHIRNFTGSLLFIIYPVGCLLSGILQDKFGKKRCMILANVPSIIGWVFLYFAQSSMLLCASTLLMGLSTGFGAGSTSSYVGEISEPRLRGSLGSLGSMATRIGTLLMYILGLFFDWKTTALISMFCPIICICFVIFVRINIWLSILLFIIFFVNIFINLYCKSILCMCRVIDI